MRWTERANLATSLLIDEAIRLDNEKGGIAAWRMLQGHGIDERTIARVLLKESQRRLPLRNAGAGAGQTAGIAPAAGLNAKRLHAD